MLATSYTAVIIDNDKNYRKSLASIVRNHFKIKDIYTCSTGREAIGVCRQLEKVDIIFCDSEISDQPTLKLIEELKKNKGSENAHYVLLSNNSKREFLLEAASTGVGAFILKPFTTKAVIENLKKLIGGKPQRKAKRIKLFNTVNGIVAFKVGVKYKGAIDDLSSGGCMVNLPILTEGGTIFDKCAIRIIHEDNNVDLTAELIRLERDSSGEEKRVNAAFIFNEMNEDTASKFATIWKALDKSNANENSSSDSVNSDAAPSDQENDQ